MGRGERKTYQVKASCNQYPRSVGWQTEFSLKIGGPVIILEFMDGNREAFYLTDLVQVHTAKLTNRKAAKHHTPRNAKYVSWACEECGIECTNDNHTFRGRKTGLCKDCNRPVFWEKHLQRRSGLKFCEWVKSHPETLLEKTAAEK